MEYDIKVKYVNVEYLDTLLASVARARKEKTKVLLKAVSQNNWYLEILLGLFCRLQKGEIMGLKLGNFDFEKNMVYINRQIASDPIMEKGSGGCGHFFRHPHLSSFYNLEG